MKATAEHVGSGKEHGKEASDVECAMEHPKDLELNALDPLSSTDEKKNSVVHVH